jgi:uncharacterized protein YjiS (DUF1127 family)
MPRAADGIRRACTTAGIAGVAASCAGMASMLPAAAAAALGAVGIGGSSALARALSSIAQPLFIASAVLLLLGALACSRLVSLLTASGSGLLYLSMFQLAAGTPTGAGSRSAMSMQHPQHPAALHAEPVAFYAGLAILVSALALSLWRRRRRECRPLLRLPQRSLARG